MAAHTHRTPTGFDEGAHATLRPTALGSLWVLAEGEHFDSVPMSCRFALRELATPSIKLIRFARIQPPAAHLQTLNRTWPSFGVHNQQVGNFLLGYIKTRVSLCYAQQAIVGAAEFKAPSLVTRPGQPARGSPQAVVWSVGPGK